MENEELIFILNTAELKENGFEGSFNDFAEELEGAGATVSGEYDEAGVPIMTIYGISTEELNDFLTDYGVDNPEEFTTEVESADDFDFDTDADGEGDGEGGGDLLPDVEGDGNDDIDAAADGDDDTDMAEASEPRIRRKVHEAKNDRPSPNKQNAVNEKRQFKGTANLSESVTKAIVAEVSDKALYRRIMESVRVSNEVADYVAPLPFTGITVNGIEINSMSESELTKNLAAAKKSFKKYHSEYKSLNESQSTKKSRFATALKKQKKLINILESALYLKKGSLNEDEMFGSANANVDNTSNTVDGGNADNGGQLATLTAITFKVKNADAFIKVLTDNGIPEEALQKVETADNANTDNSVAADNQAQQPQGGADMGGGAAPSSDMGGGNPFESLTTRLNGKNRLNEDDANPFGDTDQPAEDSGVDPLNTSTHDNALEGEEVRLVDTSYAEKVQQILATVYGFTKEQFEDKIGGSIEGADGDGSEDDASSDQFDENGQQTEDDREKVGEEETINPADVFGDLDI